ncbi:MAG: catalase/peroxidase HPI [bacterium]|nr:catalase/peroxidase HPI [bacterium]
MTRIQRNLARTHSLACLTGVLSLGLLASCEKSQAAPTEIPVSASSSAPESSTPAELAAEPSRFAAGEAKPNDYWWPNQVDLRALRHNEAANPYGDFDYAEAFEALDLDAVRKDIEFVLTDSKDWWPADYGNYGPLMVRLSWHAAGTYRVSDGRGGADGGQMRFEPLNSWPDNGNLDKARRLLWPVKQKYGRALSWADLMVLAGTVAMDSMGFETLGFAGGRVDDWEADLVYWGPEAEMLGSDRFHGDDRVLEEPLAAAHMGLIYVNPEGPDGNGDPVSAAHDIRTTFANMAMNDEETVALIAGGHTFGKSHGAHPAADCVGPEPAGADVAAQGFGWINRCNTGVGADTVTSGLEGAWTSAPVRWTNQYLSFLYRFEWEQHRSPAGALQWRPANGEGATLVPDAHDASKRHAPMMLTTDLSLREDPAYAAISKRFKEDPEAFEDAFAKAWFKLTHRDLGPRSRYLGKDVPKEVFSWQDPLPERDHPVVSAKDIEGLSQSIRDANLSPAALVRTAWSSASTYRDSDRRGGANGARIRLAPQKDWAVNRPEELQQVLGALSSIQTAFNERGAKTRISMADLIVLAGGIGLEDAARQAGVKISVPFVPGRVDASQAQTDVASFAPLEPRSDGFRNYYTQDEFRSPANALVDKADLLGLDVPEMTVLVGGLRVLGNNADGENHGVFTENPGALSNDFFVNLLDLSTSWSPMGKSGVFEGRDADGALRWTATEADLVFGSNAELRAVAEVYAYDEAKFRKDFVAAWVKVMQADRFDLERRVAR